MKQSSWPLALVWNLSRCDHAENNNPAFCEEERGQVHEQGQRDVRIHPAAH